MWQGNQSLGNPGWRDWHGFVRDGLAQGAQRGKLRAIDHSRQHAADKAIDKRPLLVRGGQARGQLIAQAQHEAHVRAYGTREARVRRRRPRQPRRGFDREQLKDDRCRYRTPRDYLPPWAKALDVLIQRDGYLEETGVVAR